MVIIAHAENIYVLTLLDIIYTLNVFLNASFVRSGTWKQENTIIIEWVTQFATDSVLLSVSCFIAPDIHAVDMEVEWEDVYSVSPRQSLYIDAADSQ